MSFAPSSLYPPVVVSEQWKEEVASNRSIEVWGRFRRWFRWAL